MNDGSLLVITPTLGRSPYLDDTVRSVAQLPVDCIHLIVAPEEQKRALQERFPQCRVISEAPTGGLYEALNLGLSRIPDGWTMFTYINDDDLILPEACRRFRQRGRACRDEIHYGKIGLIGQEGQSLGPLATFPLPSLFPLMLRAGITPFGQQGTLVGRHVMRTLEAFRTRFPLCADADLMIRARLAGIPIRYVGKRAGLFRLHPGQLSAQTNRLLKDHAAVMEETLSGGIPAPGKLAAHLLFRLWNTPVYLERYVRTGCWTGRSVLKQTFRET